MATRGGAYYGCRAIMIGDRLLDLWSMGYCKYSTTPGGRKLDSYKKIKDVIRQRSPLYAEVYGTGKLFVMNYIKKEFMSAGESV
jgi:hypothetical protein